MTFTTGFLSTIAVLLGAYIAERLNGAPIKTSARIALTAGVIVSAWVVARGVS